MATQPTNKSYLDLAYDKALPELDKLDEKIRETLDKKNFSDVGAMLELTRDKGMQSGVYSTLSSFNKTIVDDLKGLGQKF